MRRRIEKPRTEDVFGIIEGGAQGSQDQSSVTQISKFQQLRQNIPAGTRWQSEKRGSGMSTYSNVTFGDSLLMMDGPRLETLRVGKPHWQCFVVSYGLQAALLGALLTISIAAPQIAPQLESHVALIAPYLSPAPRLRAVQPTAHVIPVTPVVKAALPERRVEPKLETIVAPKVELPVPEVPRPQRVPAMARVSEMPQPVAAIPTPKFDSKLLNALPGPKAAKIVATNTFGGSSAAPTLHNIAPSKVQTGGFGDPNGVPVNAHGSDRPTIAAIGSFDLPAGGGYGNGTGGASGVRGTVASAGFGNGVAVQGGGGRGGNAAQGRIQSSGFAAAVAAPPATPEQIRQRHAASLAATSAPVSIQSKPTPVYTAEARQLKVEGEVLLNVVFSADGQVHVLNVVRGLGHGLDEAAQRAAQGIHFSPALRDGHPVDSTATLHIVFQLS